MPTFIFDYPGSRGPHARALGWYLRRLAPAQLRLFTDTLLLAPCPRGVLVVTHAYIDDAMIPRVNQTLLPGGSRTHRRTTFHHWPLSADNFTAVTMNIDEHEVFELRFYCDT